MKKRSGKKPVGWRNHSDEHALASKGIKTRIDKRLSPREEKLWMLIQDSNMLYSLVEDFKRFIGKTYGYKVSKALTEEGLGRIKQLEFYTNDLHKDGYISDELHEEFIISFIELGDNLHTLDDKGKKYERNLDNIYEIIGKLESLVEEELPKEISKKFNRGIE